MDNKFISLDECTALAISIIATATDEDRNLFRTWAAEAIKAIGVNSSWVRVCDLEIEEGSFKKPSDMHAPIDIALYNSSGCEVAYTYHPDSVERIHVSRYDVHNATVQETATNWVHLADDPFYFNLGSDRCGIVLMKLRYFATPTDKYGNLLIPDIYSLPLAYFCRFMWSLRKNDNRSEIDQNQDMWLREKDRVKGRMKMPSPLEMEAISAAWMSLFTLSGDRKYKF